MRHAARRRNPAVQRNGDAGQDPGAAAAVEASEAGNEEIGSGEQLPRIAERDEPYAVAKRIQFVHKAEVE
jgi:hypothetical protein